MTRVPALGHPTLWQAVAALRAAGASFCEVEARLSAALGRPVPRRAVYALAAYAETRTGRAHLVLALPRAAMARARAAGRARGLRADSVIAQAVDLLLADPALLDAVLDDGVATPREET